MKNHTEKKWQPKSWCKMCSLDIPSHEQNKGKCDCICHLFEPWKKAERLNPLPRKESMIRKNRLAVVALHTLHTELLLDKKEITKEDLSEIKALSSHISEIDDLFITN